MTPNPEPPLTLMPSVHSPYDPPPPILTRWQRLRVRLARLAREQTVDVSLLGAICTFTGFLLSLLFDATSTFPLSVKFLIAAVVFLAFGLSLLLISLRLIATRRR